MKLRIMCVLASLIAPSCAHRGLNGFPVYPLSDLRRAAEAVAQDIDLVRKASKRAAGDDLAHQTAYKALLDVHLALSNETDPVVLYPSVTPSRYRPCFVYPRTTFPHLAPRQKLEQGAALSWVLPFVLDARAIYSEKSGPVSEAFDVWSGMLTRDLPDSAREQADILWKDFQPTLVEVVGRVSAKPTPAPLIVPLKRIDLTGTGRLKIGQQNLNVSSVRYEILEQSQGISMAAHLSEADIGVDCWQDAKFDLRLLPRLCFESCRPQTQLGVRIKESITKGFWGEVFGFDLDVQLNPERRAAVAADLKHLGRTLQPHDSPRFAEFVSELRSILSNVREGEDALLTSLKALEGLAQRALSWIDDPAPVFLRYEDNQAHDLSFVVLADVQYHDDMRQLHKLLALIDPGVRRPEEPLPKGLTAEDVEELANVDFVICSGDLVDGESFSAPFSLAASATGLRPPVSPYTSNDVLPRMRDEIAAFRKPFFAVPGNHDARAGFGGLQHYFIDSTAAAARSLIGWAPYIGDWVPRFICWLGDLTPTIVKINIASRYDGLVDWRAYLGPANLAFRVGGHSFVALNTYHHNPAIRSAVGGVEFYSGGGVDDCDVLWTRVLLHAMREPSATPPKGEQFLFLHHDPRGSIASDEIANEFAFGRYEQLQTVGGFLTLGYAGLFYHPTGILGGGGIQIPLVTTGLEYLWRTAFHERLHHSWHQSWFLDDEACGARPLVEAINDSLGDLSAIFMAHDDVPVVSYWANPSKGNSVFHQSGTESNYKCPWEWYWYPVLPVATVSPDRPPRWTRNMNLPRGANARVVRLDDVDDPRSKEHGFYLVTIRGDDGTRKRQGAARSRVEYRWLPLHTDEAGSRHESVLVR